MAETSKASWGPGPAAFALWDQAEEIFMGPCELTKMLQW